MGEGAEHRPVRAHLADPGQVGEAAQVGVLHGPGAGPVGGEQQPCGIQLGRQLGLHLGCCEIRYLRTRAWCRLMTASRSSASGAPVSGS